MKFKRDKSNYNSNSFTHKYYRYLKRLQELAKIFSGLLNKGFNANIIFCKNLQKFLVEVLHD